MVLYIVFEYYLNTFFLRSSKVLNHLSARRARLTSVFLFLETQSQSFFSLEPARVRSACFSTFFTGILNVSIRYCTKSTTLLYWALSNHPALLGPTISIPIEYWFIHSNGPRVDTPVCHKIFLGSPILAASPLGQTTKCTDTGFLVDAGPLSIVQLELKVQPQV
jgi:hypothetical protein